MKVNDWELPQYSIILGRDTVGTMTPVGEHTKGVKVGHGVRLG